MGHSQVFVNTNYFLSEGGPKVSLVNHADATISVSLRDEADGISGVTLYGTPEQMVKVATDILALIPDGFFQARVAEREAVGTLHHRLDRAAVHMMNLTDDGFVCDTPSDTAPRRHSTDQVREVSCAACLAVIA